jgi:hypothetical protein
LETGVIDNPLPNRWYYSALPDEGFGKNGQKAGQNKKKRGLERFSFPAFSGIGAPLALRAYVSEIFVYSARRRPHVCAGRSPRKAGLPCHPSGGRLAD